MLIFKQDLIVGLASFGKASYESEYNGGMGSNGLTSARHDVFNHAIRDKFPETFDASVPTDLVYSGSKNLTDTVDNAPLDAGKLVLSPTRTYAPIIQKIFKRSKGKTFTGWCIVAEEHKLKFYTLSINYM